MSGSFESVRWNACVHTLHLSLYSHPNEFWANGVRTHVNSKEKISFTGKKNSPQRRKETLDAASSRTASPTHNQRAIPAPKTGIEPCFPRPSHTSDLNIGTLLTTRQAPGITGSEQGLSSPVSVYGQ